MRTLFFLFPILGALANTMGATGNPPIPLWPDTPPRPAKQAPPEAVDANGKITMVSTPGLTVFPADKTRNTGIAIIICPGGAYRVLDWQTHVVNAADFFNPLGVTVIGLKYRTFPPNGAKREDIRDIALLDASRAVRMVRHFAKDWGVNPAKIGVAGYSAGANLAMTLTNHFDTGDPAAADPIERESCRPDFSVGIATWHWGKKESPFPFGKTTPPVFLVHATDDKVAPIELPRSIESDLNKLGVPVHLEVFEAGAHGVGNLLPPRVQAGFPPTRWPLLLLKWLDPLLGTKKPPPSPAQ